LNLPLFAAQQTLNRLIDKRSLAPLSGLVLKLQCQDFHLFVLPEENGLHLKQDWQGRVDCQLSAPASAWFGLLSAADKAARLQEPPFALQGQADLALQLLDIVQSQPFDFAHELSRLIGPLPAALVENTIKHSRQFAQQAQVSFKHSLAEYLRTETALLPSRTEAESHFADLADAQQLLTQLEQRISRL